jgi:hypothetical protein
MNKQEIMSKYTKLAAKELYGIEDLIIEFPFYLTTGFRVWSGECTYQEDKTIRFNGALFKIDELWDMAWYLILHEISHIKVLGHSKEFWIELKNNFEKAMELRKKFYAESGLDGDSYIDFDYNIYYDKNVDEIPVNYEVVTDEEGLEHEDIYFDVYKMPGMYED